MRSFHALLIAGLVCLPGMLRADVVHIDGIVRVKAGSWKGVKLTVVPEYSAPFQVDLSSSRFDLELPLHSIYLLRAEHAGCPTKEVLFDCTVPRAFGRKAYEFPVLIELAVEQHGTHFQYAGPVGLVTFEEDRADFTYTTDYTRIELVGPLPRLHARMPASALGNSAGADPLAAAFALLLAQASTSAATSPAAAPEPTPTPVPEEPVDVVEEAPLPAPMDVAPVAVAPAVSIPPPAPVVAKTVAPVARWEPAILRTTPTHPTPEPPATDSRPCGTHDIEAHPRFVIRTDRIATADGCSELRKVVHAYGAVFFFHDGRAVTEPVYQLALGAQE